VPPVQDAGGFTIFSAGDLGAIHAMAHRMHDEGGIEEGHRRLGSWLDGRSGSGSDWIHIQFHMAVFEIELGHVSTAYDRFTEKILPVAASSSEALTDAPSLAWRLSIASGSPTSIPWEPIRRRAASRIRHHVDPFVDLHNALALAGAGDIDSLDLWLDTRRRRAATEAERLVLHVARALASYVEGDFRTATKDLSEVLSQIPRIGGSRAQIQLFHQIERATRRRITSDIAPGFLADAA
jgi:hypothetical protein